VQSLDEIKHRVKSIKDIRHITKAMSMLSTIRFKQAERRIEQARPFAKSISEVLVDVAALVGGRYHQLMTVRTGGQSAIVLFTSDRGLCGPFNDDVIKLAFDYIRENALSGKVDFLVVGKVGRDALVSRGFQPLEEYLRPGRRPTFALATRIAADVMKLFLEERIDQAFLVYSRFYSSFEQRPRVFRLLPMVPLEPDQENRRLSRGDTCLFEPSAESILGHLVPRYVETEIYRALLESDAGEQAARLTAMSAATDNAYRMIRELSLLYNRSRQSEITEELAEILGGSEALLEEDFR
jgi:F-type H+-transporting ATPase subunit gamma